MIAPSRARQNVRRFRAFLERKRKAHCDRLVTRGNNIVPLDIQSEQPTSNEKQEKPLLDICAADLSEKTPPPDEAKNQSEQLPGGTSTLQTLDDASSDD